MSANYLKGSNDANPVLILHGFLQTNEFSTVDRLTTALNDSGYTVLNPTLSLGLSNRKQSLSCEAIHTHSMDSDSGELSQWINWLQNKIGKKVTLIGHSAAGPTMLNYLEKYNQKQINHVILISLSYFASGPEANETKEHAKIARAHVRSGSKKLDTYKLNYCQTYPAFGKDFLSYYEWNTDKVSQAVGKFNDKISIIIGTSDKRIDPDWRTQLSSKYNNVIAIEGANHFFDQAYEFDLTDTIEDLLDKYSK